MRPPLSVTAVVVLAAASAMRAQTVTASSERIVVLPGSEAIFDVSVSAGGGQSPSSAAEALAPAGVRTGELTGRQVWPFFDPAGGLQLSQELRFQLVRPASQYAAVQEALRGVARSRRDLSLTFTSSTQPGDADIEAARAAALPALFLEARARAELLLAEAGFRAGPIVELAESIATLNSQNRLRLSLSLRMARLGAQAIGGAVISTVVTPAAAPYLVGPPKLEASYLELAQNRGELLSALATAGLTEMNLSAIEAARGTSSPGQGGTPGPLRFNYHFSAPVSEAGMAAVLGKLPARNRSSAAVTFPVSPAVADPVALVAGARRRAALLAELAGGGQVGDILGVTEETASVQAVALIFVTGNLSSPPGTVLPLARVGLVVALPKPAPLRYRFAVANVVP